MDAVDLIGLRNINDLLRERATAHPDKEFLVFEDAEGQVRSFTYGEWLNAVEALAAGLDRIGVKADTKVALRMRNCPELLMSWFAVARLGAVSVLTIAQSSARETHHVTSHSDAEVVITEAEYLSIYDELRSELPALRSVIVIGANQPLPTATRFDEVSVSGGQPPEISQSPDAPIQMLFTSGTTAQPKAVVLTHANCLHAGERESMIQGLEPSDRLLTCLPFFHVNAQSVTMLSALTLGATAIFLQAFSASKFMAQVRRHRATQATMGSTIAQTLLAQPERSDDGNHELRRVTYAININDDQKVAFESRFNVRFMNAYGLTEAMTVVSATPVFGDQRWPSIGRPVADRLIRLVDKDRRPVALGEVGEIAVHGRPGYTLMKQYYKDEAATADAIQDGWLYTGDLGRFDEDGYLYFVDRVKDMIKRAGENVSATEVESVLMTHPAITEAAVIGVPDPVRDEAVKAFVVLTPGAELPREALTDFCRKRLAPFKVPTIIEYRTDLPRTSVGKVEKKQLRSHG
ncbi:AMP-binding protein [Mycolicibacterium sp. XJ1819]